MRLALLTYFHNHLLPINSPLVAEHGHLEAHGGRGPVQAADLVGEVLLAVLRLLPTRTDLQELDQPWRAHRHPVVPRVVRHGLERDALDIGRGHETKGPALAKPHGQARAPKAIPSTLAKTPSATATTHITVTRTPSPTHGCARRREKIG